MKKTLILVLISLVLSAGSASAIQAIDPGYIGVGARPMGMGKAYVGVAEDGEGMFTNVAGLGRIKSPKLTSMYSNVMGDVNYFVLGGAIPTDMGTFGLGYVGANVGDILLFGESISGHHPIETGIGTYGNNVGYLSYGLNMGRVAGWMKGLYVGANLKYFSQSGEGTTEALGNNGTGMDIDLGMLYEANEWLSVGASLQNCLPANMGGKIRYNSGIEEGIPMLAKVGSRVKVMGENGVMGGDIRVDVAGDVDINVNGERPGGYHIGTEIWPVSGIALRAGLDKDPSPATVDQKESTNVTLGVGLRYGGYGFDYAYHPYSSIADNTTHYVSISYVGKDAEEGDYIEYLKPRDKLITRKSSVVVSGMAKPVVAEIRINGKDAELDMMSNGQGFKMTQELGIGKNLIVVEAYDSNGKLLQTKRIRLVRLATFTDVPNDYWAVDPVEYGVTAGLGEGAPSGSETFKPDQVMRRAELAEMMVKAKGEDIQRTIETKIFPDLPDTHWAARYIEAANEMGIIIGYPDNLVRPNKVIDRVEAVTASSRFDGLEPEPVEYAPYRDLKSTHWAAGNVEAAKDKGLLGYIKSERLNPKKGLTRAEAIEILTRTDFGKEKIDDLLNWNKGYGAGSIVR